MELIAVKKKSETMSTLPLSVISVLFAVAVPVVMVNDMVVMLERKGYR
jgi:hypothetical protein